MPRNQRPAGRRANVPLVRGQAPTVTSASALLEASVDWLTAVSFEKHNSYPDFVRNGGDDIRSIVCGWPEIGLYGTAGRKERYLIDRIPRQGGPFVIDPDDTVRVIIEAKFQATSGSVDEKLPFVFASACVSDTPNWVVIAAGAHWQSQRGQAAIAWLKAQPVAEGRRFYVCQSVSEVGTLFRGAWGE